MTKIPRIHIEGAVYYVTARGDHNENIFQDENDYLAYLGLLKKYKEQYGFKLFALCLMPNHLHLLIELKEGLTISEIMHDLNANYTKYFNGKYVRKGHLFQERYKMNLIEKNSYLLYIMADLHLNPKVMGLVEEAKDYPYSTYLYYTQEAKNLITEGLDIKDEVGEALGYLGERTYTDYLAGMVRDEMKIFADDLHKKIILGSGEFVEAVRLKITKQAQLAEQQTPHAAARKFIMAGGVVIVVLGILTFSLYTKTAGLKENLKKELSNKETELTTKLSQEREFIKKDLDERYRADRVSYEAMTKRLEIEKEKVRDLEGKLR